MRYDGFGVPFALAATLLGAAAALAQQPVRCGPGDVARPSLGISGLQCSNCTLFGVGDQPDAMRWQFRSEPTVLNVRSGGPADNRLRAGDVIVSIDGYLITTREGGRRLVQPADGRPARLRVRREGREVDVAVTPDVECVDAHETLAPVPPAPPASAVPPVRAAEVPPEPVRAPLPPAPALLPSGRLGVSLSCAECSVSLRSDSVRAWTFSEPPIVTSVEPGSPAAVAGIRSGDRIVSIDAEPITSRVGGERFGGIRSGDRIVVGIRRDGREQRVRVTAASPVPPAPPAMERPPRAVGIGSSGTPQPETMRYSGTLGDVMISVTGARVTVDEATNEIVIRSGDITVRLRRDTGRTR